MGFTGAANKRGNMHPTKLRPKLQAVGRCRLCANPGLEGHAPNAGGVALPPNLVANPSARCVRALGACLERPMGSLQKGSERGCAV
jgi:hypothetical protein